MNQYEDYISNDFFRENKVYFKSVALPSAELKGYLYREDNIYWLVLNNKLSELKTVGLINLIIDILKYKEFPIGNYIRLNDLILNEEKNEFYDRKPIKNVS